MATPNQQAAVDVQDVVAAAFATTLDEAAITPASNFFVLGGNSLLAAALVAQLRERLGLKVAIRDLFRAPTVAGLSAALRERLAAGRTG